MAKIKLTENKLKQIISESVKNVLSELYDHGQIADMFDRVDYTMSKDPWRGNSAKINPNKTPEQVAAQKERITKQFNKLHGGKGIKYDFDKNDNERHYGEIRRPDTTFHPEYAERDRWQGTTKRGGVTINGTRYVPGKLDNVQLRNGHVKNDNNWDWNSSTDYSKRSTPVAIDSNGKAVTGDKFTPKQKKALNTGANTYEKENFSMLYPKGRIKRGGTPFATNNNG